MANRETNLQGGKMDHTIDIRVFGEDLVESSRVCDIELGKLGSLAGDQLDAVDDLRRGIVEIVGDDDLVASFH
jgi:hypothetical protein